ncbi:hypothetical protein GLW07_13970 [Bacillus hwajinpoensis]|uniref:DUF4367 domain-containing protein n=1 Tax=Guptibacillus hwajinpoensis TaxID=208199 RepID=A0A845F0Y6_9BACL|nr:hypothetical protein [Pseudalkalibacillus hwajinpoensis]MYL64460.1 hypothetical protein [Pseudalkalibacillus hwajinpoensis]
MKLKSTSILFGLLLILAACSGQAETSTENQLDSLKENYPEVKTALEKLPEEFRSEVTVPDMETIPLEVSDVEAVAETKFELYGIDVYYAEDDKRLNVMVKDQKGIDSSNEETNQELDHDIRGFYSEAEDGHLLTMKWVSQNENALYKVIGFTPSEEEAAFTKEDMVEIANSIIQQRK